MEKCTGACHPKVKDVAWQQHYPGKSCAASDCHDFRGVAVNLLGLPADRQPEPAPATGK
jgi:hypothetical protein